MVGLQKWILQIECDNGRREDRIQTAIEEVEGTPMVCGTSDCSGR
jgi:hypothetical protein